MLYVKSFTTHFCAQFGKDENFVSVLWMKLRYISKPKEENSNYYLTLKFCKKISRLSYSRGLACRARQQLQRYRVIVIDVIMFNNKILFDFELMFLQAIIQVIRLYQIVGWWFSTSDCFVQPTVINVHGQQQLYHVQKLGNRSTRLTEALYIMPLPKQKN